MWFKIGDTSLDLSDVSNIALLRDKEIVIVTMKSGQQINCNATQNVTPEMLYKSLTGLLQEKSDKDDRDIEDTFKFYKRILSELEVISKELKLIVQNLRRLS